MMDQFTSYLSLKPGEWKQVLPLLMLLTINTITMEISDVVATAGFVSNAGADKIPWLWILSMVVMLLVVSVYARFADQVDRKQLLTWLFGGTAACYIIIQLLFAFGVSEGFSYLLLYILVDQQWAIFPVVFWALLSDIYSVSRAKWIFPVIGAGYPIGSILGGIIAAGTATLVEQAQGSLTQLLSLCSVLLLSAIVILHGIVHPRSMRISHMKTEEPGLRSILAVGQDFFRNVPVFYYLTLIMLMTGLAGTIVEYHFLYILGEETAGNAAWFQTFFGFYKAGFMVTLLVLQWLITGRLLKAVSLENSFIGLPGALTIAAVSTLLIPGLIGVTVGRTIYRLVERAWEEPSRKSLQGLIPSERRGAISAFIDTYFLAFSTIVGCLLLGGLIAVVSIGWLPIQTAIIIYLSVAGAVGCIAIWSALRLAKVYDVSMLNWRLTGSKTRKGRTLDDIFDKL